MSRFAQFFTETTIEFSTTRQVAALNWMHDHDLKPADVVDLTMDVNVHINLDELDDDDIADEYDRRFGPAADSLDRLQRAAAEGDCGEVLDILHREFGLAPPYHARAIADLLAPKPLPSKAEAHV